MTSLIERDYFTDFATAKDPYPWFEAAREFGPVCRPPGRDYLVVTGFAEILEVLRNGQDFSSANAVQGAAAPLPFEPAGPDIGGQIEAHRAKFLGGGILVNQDGEAHNRLRSLVSRLFTPSKLRASETFIHDFASTMVGEMVAKGRIDLMGEVAVPFVTIVVADLLGVPPEDRQMFMDAIAAAPVPGNLEGDMPFDDPNHPFVKMGMHFARYVMERVQQPQGDILSELAHAEFADGTRPHPLELVALGMFLFGAGQDTSAKLLANAMKYICDVPGLQDRLRADPALIPEFIEEVLRIEGSTKQTARVARRDTKIGDFPVPAGTRILLALAAGNRDPARWEEPEEFALNREKIREHIAFGRGAHTCSGAPLARVEIRIMLEKLLAATSRIEIDEDVHGPAGARNYEYDPSFIIRGLAELRIRLTPA